MIQWIWIYQLRDFYLVCKITNDYESNKFAHDSHDILDAECKYEFTPDTGEETQNKTGTKEDYSDSSGESLNTIDVRH